MVARSATCNLSRQFIQQLGVSLGVDLSSQQSGSTFDRQLAYFLAQAFAGAGGFACNLVVSLSDQTLRLTRRRALGFFYDFVRTLARLVDDLRSAVTRFADDLLGTRLGFAEFFFAFAGRSQARGNFLLPLLDGAHEPGPEEFHDRPCDQEKHHPLDDQRKC